MAIVFDSKRFAIAISDFCRDRGLTLTAFSEKLGIGRTNVSFFVNDKAIPSMEVFSVICQFISRDPSDFFVRQEETPLQFLMGRLSPEDKEPLERAFEKIRTLRKYEYRLSKEGV